MQTILQPTIQAAASAKMPPVQRTTNDHSIGAILVDSGKLTMDKAEAVLKLQKEKNMRFGEAALQLGVLTVEDIRFALARQYHYPYLLKGKSNVSEEVVAAYQPFSTQVESLRALRSQLMLRWFTGETEHKTLAVVSPGRSEGRSYLAANLAVVFSQLGERTLLIDADMRHPRQHKLFKLENQSGLSSILSGRGDSSTIQHVNNLVDLSVLTAGPTPPNPQELLGRALYDSLITSMSLDYDVIIIDTPAAADYADSQVIAMRSNGALVVTRQNASSLSQTQQLTEGLQQLGVLMVGAVISHF
ncbi:MAG TPA: chain length determinant protein tyrosine kinase EpsG [Methylophilaceae bacterium]|nr:chain length determinant protein tyrosine kinase EpsG [Methylophilaceae bacterium]